ncbi:MAG: hypothetical protein KDK36_22420, partial [Leptospiraceae bacterium]|nr:hypothetical protein [Leptospiraceae bacterium]
MKFFTLFLSLILSFFLFNCGNNISQPKVQNGKINLKNWDFSSNNPIKLNGSWEFYPQKFLLGDEFENYKKDTIYYPVPESWNKLPSHPGYGTYRLIIEKNSNKQKLSFKILSIKSSYNFFINGKLIYTQGRVGKLKENSFPLITSKILHLENLNIETLEVVIHISDFYHGEGGIWREIYLGEPEKIINHHYLSVSKDFIFFGMIFMIGLHYFSYHLIRKDRSNVFLPFSIFCISISLRILITEERLLVKLLPNIYSDIYIKGDYIFEFIANASFIQFISNYFIKLQNKNKIMKLFYYSFYSLSLIIFITPSLYATDIERFFRPVIIPIGFYIIYHYRELIKQKNINAKIALIFFSILLGVATNDILYSLGLIESLYLLPVGIIIFISYLSFFISLNISKSFEEFKQLSNQLEKVSEVKDNFMSNLSHELKTPLSLI